MFTIETYDHPPCNQVSSQQYTIVKSGKNASHKEHKIKMQTRISNVRGYKNKSILDKMRNSVISLQKLQHPKSDKGNQPNNKMADNFTSMKRHEVLSIL